MNRLIVFFAEGFGSGRVPKAPGTFGSLVGVLWFVALFSTGSWLWFWSGTALGAAFSVWACGRAEKILGRHDPGSVVLDEIVALPLAYGGWLLGHASDRAWRFPATDETSVAAWAAWIAAGFGLFRLFDIWKPWPIRRLQDLPGGWGVTVDDLAAGSLAGACLFVAKTMSGN